MVTEFLGRPSAGSSAVADAARSTGLFDDISEALAEVAAVTGRKRTVPERLQPTESLRGYTLPTEEVLVVVNTMIRVPWVLFNGSAAGKAPRESRSGLYILGEEWYNRLLESV